MILFQTGIYDGVYMILQNEILQNGFRRNGTEKTELMH